ncbi:MAG TPA: response regulator, partial [Bacteroidales bacterium]|nr:response regulator [Bacteroidales bacterium]
EAATGKEGLQILEREKHINLVLADICLPDADGYSLIRKIRNTYPNIPVIAQTALAYKHDQQKCLEAGASYYLSKPFLKEDLMHAIRQCILPGSI